MKKSFTLLEVVISIAIFMIMVLFLYKALDEAKYTNKLFLKNKEKSQNIEDIYNILLEDFAQSSKVSFSLDKEKNSIIKLETSNIYHNPYYKNVTYFIGSNFKLVRIESFEQFNPTTPPTIDFFEKSYTDILLDDIEFFEISKFSETKYVVAIKQKNKERLFFNLFKNNTNKP